MTQNRFSPLKWQFQNHCSHSLTCKNGTSANNTEHPIVLIYDYVNRVCPHRTGVFSSVYLFIYVEILKPTNQPSKINQTFNFSCKLLLLGKATGIVCFYLTLSFV